MGNLGLSELALIAVLALIFIGPKQLPEIARAVGRFLNEFRRLTGDFSSSVSKMKIDLDSPVTEKTKNDHEDKMVKEAVAAKMRDSNGSHTVGAQGPDLGSQESQPGTTQQPTPEKEKKV